MIFSELYSAYYNTVAKILKAAVDHPLQKNELRQIIENTAFGESILNIEPALKEERWQLIHKDGTTPIVSVPSMPLTDLQKRWLKAISSDPRLRLFADEFPKLPGVEPLFSREDYFVFDRYADGDPYEDETYIKNFRLILDAIRNRYPLSIDTTNRRGNMVHLVLMPEYLEYSEKDDKFRLISSGDRYGSTTNLGRIVSCEPYDKPYDKPFEKPFDKPWERPFDINLGGSCQSKRRMVEFELVDKRNALERVLLHFAHFEKEAEKAEDGRYIVRIAYDKDDETEIVIRILSFGPMIRVTEPQSFVDLIKERLIHQKSCGQ